MKPAASLTGSLLARKGTALPSQGLEPVGYASDVQNRPGGGTAAAAAPAAQEASAAGSAKRVAMTLRLDHEQHLKLRLFSAHLRQSSQDVLQLALKAYMDEHAPQSFDEVMQGAKS